METCFLFQGMSPSSLLPSGNDTMYSKDFTREKTTLQPTAAAGWYWDSASHCSKNRNLSSFHRHKKQLQANKETGPAHSQRKGTAVWNPSSWLVFLLCSCHFKVLNMHWDMLFLCSKLWYVCSRGGFQTLAYTNRNFPVVPKQDTTHSSLMSAREGTALSLQTKDIPCPAESDTNLA